MLRHQPLLLTILTTISFLLILAYCLLRSRFLKWEPYALSLILGGALGNLVDRILWGKVTDFFDVVIIHYPIFNLADSFIFCGVLLLLYTHLRPQPQAIAAPRPATQPNEHV
jgi:signal peptidase II